MKVKDLIDILNSLPPTADVYFADNLYGGPGRKMIDSDITLGGGVVVFSDPDAIRDAD